MRSKRLRSVCGSVSAVVIESENFLFLLLTDGWASVPTELQIVDSRMSKYVCIIPIILQCVPGFKLWNHRMDSDGIQANFEILRMFFFFFLKDFSAIPPLLIRAVSTQSDPVVPQIPKFSGLKLWEKAAGKYGGIKWKVESVSVSSGIIFTCTHWYSTNSLKSGFALYLHFPVLDTFSAIYELLPLGDCGWTEKVSLLLKCEELFQSSDCSPFSARWPGVGATSEQILLSSTDSSSDLLLQFLRCSKDKLKKDCQNWCSRGPQGSLANFVVPTFSLNIAIKDNLNEDNLMLRARAQDKQEVG